MRTHSIAAIPADGIGPEVIFAGVRVLEALAKRSGDLAFNIKTFDWGSDYYKKHGVMMPADGLDELKKFDAIYFGAVGAPDVPDHITLWGLRLPICQGFDQYANVRPTKILPGVASPLRNVGVGDLDWVIVRENSEGEYAGQGGRSHRGLPEEVATEVSIFTRAGVSRIREPSRGRQLSVQLNPRDDSSNLNTNRQRIRKTKWQSPPRSRGYRPISERTSSP